MATQAPFVCPATSAPALALPELLAHTSMSHPESQLISRWIVRVLSELETIPRCLAAKVGTSRYLKAVLFRARQIVVITPSHTRLQWFYYRTTRTQLSPPSPKALWADPLHFLRLRTPIHQPLQSPGTSSSALEWC